MRNINELTVADYGEAWAAYDPSAVPESEILRRVHGYLGCFPGDRLPPGAEGFDLDDEHFWCAAGVKLGAAG